ncbi:hypothetical protein [Bacteroides nordii]|uniref:hypothetical protein n=1 Tax=Bacteroides nordii TaxID=291645 RepID=UPI00241D1217|nr:hypothetical protein [Bacteroides nordii]
MELVINRCYGGFNLSPIAVKEYLKRKGKECFVYICDSNFNLNKTNIEDAGIFVFYSTEDLGETISSEVEYEKSHFVPSDIDRSDKDLVSIVKEFGNAASGRFSELKIVEIPDDVDWEVSEYNGMEIIDEKHRSWC